ncbi:MAG: S1 RNA-binding domain-containing protein [Phycisphaerales bacterium]|nr:S1 RNA-binding domain-containing protein [Phycisphaerales bacterium]
MDPTTSNPALSNPETLAAGQTPPTEKPALDAELNKEIDEMMAAMDRESGANKGGGGSGGPAGKKDKGARPITLPGHDIAPIGGPAKAALKGPRVVSGGREHRTGIIVSIGPTDIFLEFGPKELGVMPRLQYKEGEELPAVGSQLEVAIDRFEAGENIFICSRPGAVIKAAWENLEVGQTVEGKVVGVNKGGLEIEVAGHRAFMPASQVSLDRIPDLSVMIGEKLTCQVSQLDKRGRGNIVLSRRDILAEERKQRATSLKTSLKEGDVLDGTVRKIMPFGAFIDIGGVDGLVHVSDLSYDRIGMGEQAIAKHIKEGQAVKVKVLKIEWNEEDMRKSRISLGLKQLAADPFTTAAGDIKEGAEVNGRVTRLAEFGAFVEVAAGVEGLVHVSEIAHRRVNHPQDELKVDQVVQAKVLKIDPTTRRISLSIKAMVAAPERPGKKGDDRTPKRSVEEITKETPALRRLRAQAAARDKGKTLKGGF